jgi:DtxR family Mn-dependent transcriptional regulator
MTGANTKQSEYLAEAYRIAYYQEGNPYISTSALAEEMNVSAPAVTRMIQRLKDAGYVHHEPYRGLRLTDEGERAALVNIRTHRVVERFLVDVMKFDWHEVHEIADEWGFALSERVVDRMEEMAGYPKRCPHGEPIPDIKLTMPRIHDEPLSDAALSDNWVVSRVHTHDDKILHYIEELGLRPGAPFALVDKAPFNGPLKVVVAGTQHFIGYEIAKLMYVCPRDEYMKTV